MSTYGHIEALERRHRELEQQIAEEMQHRTFNDMRVAQLKRRKLEVKDEIARLQRQTTH